ncbi:YchJ family protein [Nocardiopsis xinjiangensis]|uniref:YchJ family protein n=1 Tax=Nocardiopsis xinjiangensis TaxID=124285 RepID=UPI000476BD94|nr:YchJ family metal-binding protein [Nocardiopsis xinjiangensis]
MPRRRSRTSPSVPAAGADCPCGSGRTYAECCGLLHAGTSRASTAEQLMRSRYSAFAVGDQAYLRRSWHPDTCPPDLRPDAGTTWTGLEILAVSEGTPFHREGTVEFAAHYRDASGPGQMREHSRFVRHEGAWVYLGALTER